MDYIYFLVVLVSCTIGSISGVGGGIIIKPVIDSMGTMPLAVINFLSSTSVLTMAVVSVLSGRKSGVKLQNLITVPLAIGSSFGGIAARTIFNILREYLQNDTLLSIVQSAILLSMNVFILLYLILKSKIKTRNVKNIFLSFAIGFFLSIVSSFLGLGGGPVNIAILYYFYSMNAKTAALNSLFIIVFSQSTSIFTTILSGSTPSFATSTLLAMASAAIIGASIGRNISKKLGNKEVEIIFIYLMSLLIALNIYNVVSYSLLL